MAKNVPELIKESCERFAGRPALAAEGCELTYAGLWENIGRLAAAMRARGLEPGGRVVLLAENSPWWGVTHLATLAAGGTIVPLLPDFPAADVHHVIRETGPALVFVSPQLADRVASFDDPGERTVVMMPNGHATCPAGWLRFEELTATDAAPPPLPESGPDDLAVILYTSGTSGHSKGVLLSHGNLVANVRSAESVIRIREPWRFLSLLPLAHAYEFTAGFMLPLVSGASVYYPGIIPSPALLRDICARVRPQVMILVPLIIEKIYRKRIKPQLEKHPAARIGRYLPFISRLAARKAGKKLVSALGGEIRAMAIGGAALDRETEDFLRLAGIPFVCGYGLSEAAPLVAAGPFGAKVTPGSVGRPVAGVEVRIDREREGDRQGVIMVRGDNVFKGYLGRDDLTAEVLRDGWLDTGDIGFLDESGCLHITGRAKNVIVLANGENIYPEVIEARFAASPLVAEVLAVEAGGAVEALVHPDYDYIDQNLPGTDEAALTRLLEELRQEVNDLLPASHRVRRVRERREPFLKTATQKIKRYLYTQ